jgi:hypothetical protein
VSSEATWFCLLFLHVCHVVCLTGNVNQSRTSLDSGFKPAPFWTLFSASLPILFEVESHDMSHFHLLHGPACQHQPFAAMISLKSPGFFALNPSLQYNHV